MNTRRWSAVCVWLVLPALAAQAQTPDAAALERAQREAESPLRLIIEAGKIRPKSKADADAKSDAKADSKAESKAAADKPSAQATAAKPTAVEPVAREVSAGATRAAALASVRGLTSQAAPQSADESQPPASGAPSERRPVATATAQPSKLAAAEAAQPAEPAPIQAAAASDAQAAPPESPPAAGSTAVAAVPASPAAPSTPSVAASTAPATPAAAESAALSTPPLARTEPDAAAPATARQDSPAVSDDPARVALAVATPAPAQQSQAALELLNVVQPELPERVLSRMRRDGEVTLVFKVNPDGSVADLNVQASNSAVLDAIVLDAVRQWRYKPIAQARTHRVQFVFKRE